LGEIVNDTPLSGGEEANRIQVWRNDAIDIEELVDKRPNHVIISPGPGTPQQDSGISNEVIRYMGDRTPILGVCLGQQCIGHVHGGKVERAPRLMHGKVSPIHHKGTTLFQGIPTPFTATRYHSLIVEEPLPAELEATAHTVEGELMGVQHRSKPIFGVQFHPESILTQYGHDLLRNFLNV
jgi:anthranilate synthase/aminodeoxychorismate synthase-like glutamine amidotransferase